MGEQVSRKLCRIIALHKGDPALLQVKVNLCRIRNKLINCPTPLINQINAYEFCCKVVVSKCPQYHKMI